MVAPFILQRSQCQQGLIPSLSDVKLSLSDVHPIGMLETSEKRIYRREFTSGRRMSAAISILQCLQKFEFSR